MTTAADKTVGGYLFLSDDLQKIPPDFAYFPFHGKHYL